MKRRLFFVSFSLVCPVIAQDTGRERSAKGSTDEADAPIEFASPQLAVLDAFVGPWNVTESHFNARGELAAAAQGTEETAWILDHRAIRRNYSTSGGSASYKALGTMTWNDADKKYHAVWFDNASTTGPGVAKGVWDADTRTMLLELETLGTSGEVIRHRIVDKFESAMHRTVTTYQMAEGGLVKRVQVEYRRAKPCPDRLRILFEP